jgi:hypothetical protein
MGANNSEVLSSWEEIAAYLGKGVSTVQRWERELGLPVHRRRPHDGDRDFVIAVPAELDEWLKGDLARREVLKNKPALKTFRYRVLVVDDDPSFLETMTAILESRGYEVLEADDGFAGLAALRESLPDVILSDLKMPNMNGFEFLSVVRHRFPRLPVIAISGEFKGVGVPDSVLADFYFEKGSYSPPSCSPESQLCSMSCRRVHVKVKHVRHPSGFQAPQWAVRSSNLFRLPPDFPRGQVAGACSWGVRDAVRLLWHVCLFPDY